jgi:hypothetical protein
MMSNPSVIQELHEYSSQKKHQPDSASDEVHNRNAQTAPESTVESKEAEEDWGSYKNVMQPGIRDLNVKANSHVNTLKKKWRSNKDQVHRFVNNKRSLYNLGFQVAVEKR